MHSREARNQKKDQRRPDASSTGCPKCPGMCDSNASLIDKERQCARLFPLRCCTALHCVLFALIMPALVMRAVWEQEVFINQCPAINHSSLAHRGAGSSANNRSWPAPPPTPARPCRPISSAQGLWGQGTFPGNQSLGSSKHVENWAGRVGCSVERTLGSSQLNA